MQRPDEGLELARAESASRVDFSTVQGPRYSPFVFDCDPILQVLNRALERWEDRQQLGMNGLLNHTSPSTPNARTAS